MKVSIAQIPIISACPKDNFNVMKKNIEMAKEQKSHLILFPEMALPGYFNGDIWETNSFLKECEHYAEQIAALSKGIHIIFGSVGLDWKEKNEDGRVRKYNALFHAWNGKFTRNSKTGFLFWPKTLMPNYRQFDDSRHFYDLRKLAYEKKCRIEDLYEPIQMKYENETATVGLSVCEDGWNTDYGFSPVVQFSEKYQHDFFINASCSPFSTGKLNKRDRIFSALSQKIKCPIFYVNCTGVQNLGKTVFGFDGSSALYDHNKTIPLGRFFTDDLPTIDTKNTGHPKNTTPQNHTYETQIALEYILKKCCQEWNIKRIVVGVSGGIDSALSAVLCTRVLGKENVYLVNMPSRYNSELTKNAAHTLAQNLGCAYAVVGIDESLLHTQKQLQNITFENSNTTLNVTNFVLENIQARDRGSRILSAIAATLGAVFTCNGNKSEITVGYCTLYGDQAGFLCPIGDLWKHEVYELAHHYNTEIFKREVIPKETLEVVPSAELSEEQNVLEGKGDPLIYEYHDYLFRSWVEHWQRKTPNDNLEAYLKNEHDSLIGCKPGLTQKLFPTKELFLKDLERWWKSYAETGAFKRMQAPPVVALSPRAFGLDHRDFIRKSS